MTFAAVIQTVLTGLIVAVITTSAAKQNLHALPNSTFVVGSMGAGFLAYILTAIFGVLAFWETKWIPAPEVLFGEDPAKWRKVLDGYNDDPTTIPIVGYEMQLRDAVKAHQETNNRKYDLLRLGFISLISGIVLTAAAGLLILAGSF